MRDIVRSNETGEDRVPSDRTARTRRAMAKVYRETCNPVGNWPDVELTDRYTLRMDRFSPTTNTLGDQAAFALGARNARPAKSLNRLEFFETVVVRVRSVAPAEFSGFRHRAHSMLLKIDFGNERVHFEVWPDTSRSHIEIGLHFEDGPASTAAYLAFFDSRIVEIKHLLGQHVELERWTLSWGHLFETVPLKRLEVGLARNVADRLVAQIALLQPMVVEAEIPPERRDQQASTRGRWTRRGRA